MTKIWNFQLTTTTTTTMTMTMTMTTAPTTKRRRNNGWEYTTASTTTNNNDDLDIAGTGGFTVTATAPSSQQDGRKRLVLVQQTKRWASLLLLCCCIIIRTIVFPGVSCDADDDGGHHGVMMMLVLQRKCARKSSIGDGNDDGGSVGNSSSSNGSSSFRRNTTAYQSVTPLVREIPTTPITPQVIPSPSPLLSSNSPSPSILPTGRNTSGSGISLSNDDDNNNNNSNRMVDLKDLEFVHIPKTGGTAIEQMGWEQNQISWGIRQMKFPRKWLFDRRCPPWHVPPKVYLARSTGNKDEDDNNKGGGNNTTNTTQMSLNEVRRNHNPYRNKTLFTIVRNPYDRVISEYYFDAQMWKRLSANETHHSKSMNNFVQFFIRKMNETKTINDYTTRCFGHGHWIPQLEFVYDDEYSSEDEKEEDKDDDDEKDNNSHPQGRRRRLVEYVLKYETLQHDLSELQRRITVGTHNSKSSSPSLLLQPNFTLPSTKHHPTTKMMTVQNLTSKTRQLIESYYKLDFELFGYDMYGNK